LKKFNIEIKRTEKQKLNFLINQFESVIYSEKKGRWFVSILVKNSDEDIYLAKSILEDFEIKKVETIRKKNWVNENVKYDNGIVTDFFFFSQGLKESKKNKKFNIIIPASNSFGTGSHESTFLALKNIECILKKKRVIKCFDLGTGTGILTFAMRKITKKKIYSSDCDLNAGKNFNINKKINYLNNVFFFHCWGFNHFSLKKQKFDLIVSNLFLNPLKKLTKDFWYHLTKNGILIISGILKNQRNELIMHFTKFNLKLLKINYIGNWTSIVFQKK